MNYGSNMFIRFFKKKTGTVALLKLLMLCCDSHLKSNCKYIKHNFSILSKEGREKRKAKPCNQSKITVKCNKDIIITWIQINRIL